MEKSAAGDRSPGGSNYLFYALAEQNRLAEAIKIHPLDASDDSDPFHFLALAVAWRLAGNLTEAERWQARALKLLDEGETDWTRAAALLRRATDPEPDE